MQLSDINFLIIGAGKSATTWLQTQLQADPDIYMPDPEIHYFSRCYDRGIDWYLAQFDDEGAGKLVGEKSNSYLDHPEAANRIHGLLPDVKLIAQLRNPVERAYSHYCMMFNRGAVGPEIETHLDPESSEMWRLFAIGDYASHLQRFIDLFGRERLLILFFEGVKNDPDKQMRAVRDHLGLQSRPLAKDAVKKVKDKTSRHVPHSVRERLAWMKPIVRPFRGTPAFETVRASIAREVQYPPLTKDLRDKLNDHFAPSIEALEKISGRSLNHWYRSMTPAE